jgi:hypothetical protein
VNASKSEWFQQIALKMKMLQEANSLNRTKILLAAVNSPLHFSLDSFSSTSSTNLSFPIVYRLTEYTIPFQIFSAAYEKVLDGEDILGNWSKLSGETS